jgi:hypothetical protein
VNGLALIKTRSGAWSGAISGQFSDTIQGPIWRIHCNAGQRMWLDLLVASGLSLPALVYGSLLFVNYMQ